MCQIAQQVYCESTGCPKMAQVKQILRYNVFVGAARYRVKWALCGPRSRWYDLPPLS